MKVIITKKNDWKGNYKSIYSTLGASNHSDYERAENDFYSTDPKAINYLLKYEKFDNKIMVTYPKDLKSLVMMLPVQTLFIVALGGGANRFP